MVSIYRYLAIPFQRAKKVNVPYDTIQGGNIGAIAGYFLPCMRM